MEGVARGVPANALLPETWPLAVFEPTKEQFRTVKKLLSAREVEYVVCATDAGREGELVFRFIYEAAGCRKPVRRLWISSLTPGAIQAGLQVMKDGRAYDSLAAAARGRAQADWLVGMNLSRAYTIADGDTFSVGRVQTPTLAMLVEREKEIREFVAERYLEVLGTFGATPHTGIWFKPGSTPSNESRRVYVGWGEFTTDMQGWHYFHWGVHVDLTVGFATAARWHLPLDNESPQDQPYSRQVDCRALQGLPRGRLRAVDRAVAPAAGRGPSGDRSAGGRRPSAHLRLPGHDPGCAKDWRRNNCRKKGWHVPEQCEHSERSDGRGRTLPNTPTPIAVGFAAALGRATQNPTLIDSPILTDLLTPGRWRKEWGECLEFGDPSAAWMANPENMPMAR
jgi:hypothetical protein